MKKRKKIDWSNTSLIEIYKECGIKKFDHVSVQVFNENDEWVELNIEYPDGAWFFQDQLFKEYFGPFKDEKTCKSAFSVYYKERGFKLTDE